MKRFIYILVTALILAACSTTKNLPEGEILYTGQKPIKVENLSVTPVGVTAMEEVEAALAKAPNNSLLGSSQYRIPFPFGLWVYNDFGKYKKGFGKLIFNLFAATPVFISTVNPDVRKKVATNILHDYGYFNGTVDYQTFINPKDSLKAKLQYTVNMRNPYSIDTVYYHGFNKTSMRIIDLGRRRSLISPGEQFNVTDLDGERTRISTLLRNMGYYYFRPDYLIYQADTTLVRGGHVSLRMTPVPGMPKDAERPFFVGNVSFYLHGPQGQMPNDSLYHKNFWLHYYNKLKIRPNMLYRWLNYQGYHLKRQQLSSGGLNRRPEKLYSQYRQTRIQERLASVGIFRYTEVQYTPRDTALISDTLDVNIRAMLDKPYDAELDFNVIMKSNNQAGPGAAFTVTKNNVFGGGETWNVKVNGSYEWQTGGNSSSLMNSYEVGVSTSLVFPRVVFPRLGALEYDFPASTTFRIYIDQMNRAKYYQLLAFGGNVTYDFQPVPTRKHSITPFQLTFNVLRNPTPAFDALQAQNPALYISLRDQFIPKMEYTFTYDNASVRGVRNPIWWQTTVASAGNLTSLIYQTFGQSFNRKDKKLLGVPFAQFLKLNSEFRYHYRIDRNQMIASRIAGGVIWSYGNATTAPYTEQFYIGGANSVRAYSARSIGPGGYPPDKEKKYSYINHVGDIRMEANLEYRFRILADLHGAVFLDAGNVWLMREDTGRPDGKFTLKNFPKQIALGTGIGVRYDLDFLVFRLDWGIALHDPYDTGKKGYYNIPSFKDGMAWHFAIGYPF
ncbi:BamA/TamA family outer membrane protein [Bacteroides sp. UBA939]|uniref:translocation and assembly module lipoprotein TamL n=1 Tax=Bacteroides sp. UBA939 TaxID=1946092 RepID=UPI0025BAB53D|nr:BamA/TamA family outer membrane protein [Bacteroides sp. UBA939]